MSSGVTQLLQPVQLGALSLRNRVMMAPMTRERSPGGIPVRTWLLTTAGARWAMLP